MRINIASKNPVKISAVKEVIKDYSFLANAEVVALEVDSGISKQPLTLDELMIGAMNRSSSAFQNCDYSFGIESGLMPVLYSKTGYMDICCCTIFDGQNYHSGLSCAFELPLEVIRKVLQEGSDLNEAFYSAGLTDNLKLGNFEGAIGILTRGRVTRKDYTIQAIQMALIHLEDFDLYRR